MLYKMRLTVCLFLVCVVFATSGYGQEDTIPQPILHDDLITAIPGLEEMPTNFNMYSGYLNVGRESKKMFYWLNEATEYDNNVLMVWLNGGPGCSSLQGLFTENGPFMFNEDTEKLETNPFSWNKFAHTLYLEAPINTGFSHTINGFQINSTDHNAASDLMKALENFMEVHERYRHFDLFLAGQSYAGIYIPTLAVRLTEKNSSLASNLKGIILGNPLLNVYLNDKSRATYAYTHGYLSYEMYDFVNKYDCYNKTATATFGDYMKQRCITLTKEVDRTVLNHGINIYNIQKKCWRKKTEDVEQQLLDMLKDQFGYEESYDGDQQGNGTEVQDNVLANYGNDSNNETASSGGGGVNLSALFADYGDGSSEETVETSNTETELEKCNPKSAALERFLSREDVQVAIHAGVRGKWVTCSDAVFNNHEKRYTDMTSRIKKLVKQHEKAVLLYYGDLDLACNVYGGREFVQNLGFKPTNEHAAFYITRAHDESLAGFHQQFADLLTFAVVKGAGHSVPADKPEESQSLVSKWIEQCLN